MTDREFDILDELYFISSFEELLLKTEMEESILKKELKSLISKGWVKIMIKDSDQDIQCPPDFETSYKKYNYLATKSGLLAHNGR